MIVECVANKGKDLPRDWLDPSRNLTEKTKFPLVIGKKYTVYAFILRPPRGIRFYVYDENDVYLPIWYPAPLFVIVDHRLSKYWEFHFDDSPSTTWLIMAYPEWARDPWNYYNALSDQEKEAVEIFERYRRLMDSEFANSEDN